MRKPSLRYIDVASRAGTKLSIFAWDNGLCYTSRAERFQHFNEKKSSLPWLRLVPVLLSPNLLGAMNVLSADRRTTERQRVSRLLSAREELLYRAHFFECCFCMSACAEWARGLCQSGSFRLTLYCLSIGPFEIRLRCTSWFSKLYKPLQNLRGSEI